MTIAALAFYLFAICAIAGGLFTVVRSGSLCMLWFRKILLFLIG